MKLSERPATLAKHVLLFGPPKSGKTRLAGALASHFNLVYIDMENGIDSLYALPKEAQERIEVVSLPDTRGFPIAIQTALKLIKGDRHSVCTRHGAIACPICKKDGAPFTDVHLASHGLGTIVVFDSLTQLTNSAIAHITKNQPEDYKLQQDDWGNLGKLMDMFLSYVQNAPFHVICISHETEVEMEDGKQKLVATAGTRNFSRNSAKYFGEVVYVEVKNGKHSAASSTTYSGKMLTGSRMNVAIEKMANPSLLDIFLGNVQVVDVPKPQQNVAPTPAPAPQVSAPAPAPKPAMDLAAIQAAIAARKNGQS